MRFILAIALLAIIFGCAINTEKEQATQQIQEEQSTEKSNMKLTSNAFDEENRRMPKKYTCQGENINPELIWSDVPEKTKSFALIVDDPDAPSGTWVHWLVKDMLA